MRVAIIGGGLAGCAAAYALKARGHDPVIYEAGDILASGASGNMLGLYNPRFCADYNAHSQYYEAAFRHALAVFAGFGDDVDFNPCGCLHLITSDKKRVQFTKMLASWAWGDDAMRIVNAGEASRIAGVDLAYEAMYLPQSGSVSPVKLCAAYSRGVEVHLNTRIEALDDVDADAVIVAAGHLSAEALGGVGDGSDALTLYPVRGQVSVLRANEASRRLQCAVNYNGYLTPARDGVHMIGSTFQRGEVDMAVRGADDDENLENLAQFFPDLRGALDVVDSRASVRTASRDYFPLVGPVRDGVCISTGHGSHGILSTLLAGQILAGQIGEQDDYVADNVLSALSPRRFVR